PTPNSATCSRRRAGVASDGQLKPRSIVSSKLACRPATSLFGLRSTLHFMTGEVQMSWNAYASLPPAASFSLTSRDLREGEKLAIDKEATPAWLMYQVWGCTLGRAFLEGWYER